MDERETAGDLHLDGAVLLNMYGWSLERDFHQGRAVRVGHKEEREKEKCVVRKRGKEGGEGGRWWYLYQQAK